MVKISEHLFQGDLNLAAGRLGAVLREFGADLIIGHPTLKNQDNIRIQLKKGILGAATHFPDRKVAFVVSDGSFTFGDQDAGTIKAALEAAQEAFRFLDAETRSRILVAVTPYGGYLGNRIQGKGSALKLLFEEMAFTRARALLLLDGDLRNEMADWLRVFRLVMDNHEKKLSNREFQITARYARHFVDASLTRNIVGPITTLFGRYVPGAISGDIVLSAGAVALERKKEWSEARFRYGTDISTTLDNIASGSEIYEVYLGAKLHDVTDDTKLSIMPAEVIGAALERLLYYERLDGRISRLLTADDPLDGVCAYGPDKTGIPFINPGKTSVFKLEAKRKYLLESFHAFVPSLTACLTPATFHRISEKHRQLEQAVTHNLDTPLFLNFSSDDWISVFHEIVGFVLATGDIENGKRGLNYLYSAVFLEFCKLKLQSLGLCSIGEIEQAQTDLGVPDSQAEEFYRDQVDRVTDKLASDFHARRRAVLCRMNALKSGHS